MDRSKGLSRRSAVAGLAVGLWARRIRLLLLPFAALSAMGSGVRAQPRDDPIVVVELRTPHLELLERIVKRKGVEIIRVVPAPREGGVARAVIALKRSDAVLLMRTEGVSVEIVSEPPRTDADVPEVGKGNRFGDRQALPRGQGKLVKP